MRCAVVLVLGVLGCDRSPEKPPPIQSAEQPELLDPVELDKKGLTRCQRDEGFQSFSVRTPKGKGAVEVGAVVYLEKVAAVSGLRQGDDQEAFVLLSDGKGRQELVDLGQVHGQVEVPLLVKAKDFLIAGVFDSDASGIVLRIARLSPSLDNFGLVWGPSIPMPRDDFPSASLGILSAEGGESIGVVAWDEEEKRSLRSRIYLSTFFLSSMKVATRSHPVSKAEADAVAPLITSSEDKSWLTWLQFGSLPQSGVRGDSEPLVEEPPRSLWLTSLGERGEAKQSPLRLSREGQDVVAFDAASAGENLVVAYRTASTVGEEGGSPIRITLVKPDGSTLDSMVAHESLGPGAPLLLSEKGTQPWLVARGQDQQLLASGAAAPPTFDSFFEEASLGGVIPAARLGSRLMFMEAEGLDFRFSVSKCDFSAENSMVKPPG